MLKKLLSILLVLCLVLTAFVGCTNKEEPKPADEPSDQEESSEEEAEEPEESPQVFTYNLGAEPETLDPGKATENIGINILGNTSEGLTRVGKDGNPEPGVAEKWDISEDGKVYTFHLRENAKWSDGKSVTANDFVYSWRRVLDPATAADYAYFLYPILNAEAANNGEVSLEEVGVEAVDEHTLKVTLTDPVNYFLSLCTFVTMQPVREDVVTADPEGWGISDDGMISNGPFYVKEWTHNEKVIMVKNPEYWDADKVRLEEVEVTLINEESTALAAFEAGDVDAIDNIPVAEIPRLLSESDEIFILPDLSLYYYVFNNNEPPFDNELVRKAFALAIDRKAIVDTVTMDSSLPATGLVPNGISYGGGDFRESGGDYGIKPEAQIEEAKKLLEEAGYPNGEGLPPVKLNYNTSERHKKIAEAIQEMWKKNLGVDVEIVNQEWKVHLSTLEEGNFQIARIGWGADYVHPMTFFDMWIEGSGNNYSGFFDAEFDKLVKEAMITLDENKAAELLHQAEDIWMNRMTISPIYYASDPEMVKGYVKDWWKSPVGNMFLRDAYIEK
ncbi:peptide ABC transporter substrate-binding protein [Clostridium sp. D2Q-11]|uniref:Peptide ABC transporter substrate-binding protein n=1 Tax=Anaeromonas frigoriresistens TaxID=2683708 RepID=A0A942UQZ6_9FIRM|nr:peptide ABC transporter substrate-binding protein [Anaeromonas frigoriresistens]MBS4536953.1 peptide ABC transporter substrate-binding protein [Anaeromonas frigoriresistens]